MGGNKRQEKTSSSLRSTSGRQDSVSPVPGAGNQTKHNAKAVNVGCMSGIFHLVSKYHTRRKFLTFGKKQEIKIPSQAKPQPTTTTTMIITCKSRDNHYSSETTKTSSLEVPRSPMLPAEIRSSGSANSPRVVARLMGIEDITAPLPQQESPLASVVAESAAEKRRKLLGALEKCDEDLKALKKIIDAVRGSQTPKKAVDRGGGRREEEVDDEGGEEEEEEREEEEEEPSPVSVLDFHHPPPLTGHSKRTRYGQVLQHQQQHHIQMQHKPKAIRKLKLGEEYISTLTSVFLPTKTRPPLIYTYRKTPPPMLPWSKAVVESVEEVCQDVEWGHTRELGSIVLLIQDFIFKDLIEEITKEMIVMRNKEKKRGSSYDSVFGSSRVVSFPFETYKRKLCY